MSIYAAIVLATVASAGFSVALAFQKAVALNLEKLTFPPRWGQLRSFITSWRWLAAYGLAIVSWVVLLAAQAYAPVTILQPIQGAGLMVLAFIAVFYLKERLSAGEWAGVAVLTGGLLLLGASASEHEAGDLQSLSYLGLTAISLALAGGVFLFWLIGRRRLQAINLELLIGAAGGILIGIGALYSRPMMLELRAGRPGVFIGLLCLVGLLSIAGDFTQQGGYQRGRAMTIATVRLVVTHLVTLLGGFLVLGEALPQDSLKAGLRVAALVALLLGTVMLSRFGGTQETS
jgi:drug/metabolite transporter (DMT)-like permease